MMSFKPKLDEKSMAMATKKGFKPHLEYLKDLSGTYHSRL